MHRRCRRKSSLQQRKRRRDAHVVLAIVRMRRYQPVDGLVSPLVQNEPVDVQPHHQVKSSDVVPALRVTLSVDRIFLLPFRQAVPRKNRRRQRSSTVAIPDSGRESCSLHLVCTLNARCAVRADLP